MSDMKHTLDTLGSLLCTAALVIATGCATGSGSTRGAVAEQPEPTENRIEARESEHEDADDAGPSVEHYDGELTQMCPMEVEGTMVQSQTGPEGVALIFETAGPAEATDELRMRVRRFADRHNEHVARGGEGDPPAIPGAAPWDTPGLAGARALVRHVPEGAMMVFVPEGEDRDQAQREAEIQAQWMNTGNCPRGLQQQAMAR